MAQQTAVEWLEHEINKRGPKENNPPQWLKDLYEQAKQMEREHHDITFTAGYDYRSSKEKDIIEAFGINSKPTFEQYYTQTYGTRLQNETN